MICAHFQQIVSKCSANVQRCRSSGFRRCDPQKNGKRVDFAKRPVSQMSITFSISGRKLHGSSF